MSRVSIILGSKSDMPVAEKAIAILRRFGIDFDIAVASAHRTPARVEELVKNSSADVFIAIAGLSAALPGSVAALTVKPVIGVPVSGTSRSRRSDSTAGTTPPSWRRRSCPSGTRLWPRPFRTTGGSRQTK